ncbi:hypothetical protein HD553DRAFT_346756 [Filobasidium floriforme]|uniref:uncharacterized protein n=1 Tax=Filobasidium floriforme TaxID=5210 RepID=UPI001E8EDC2F|nr:uncharacterized protein HD553DRAFT_346756 [Filobasidium floriforme]KAH8077232.1 hypothetical protein HD553DRAFT_346756 [Filobasidium floriforme]
MSDIRSGSRGREFISTGRGGAGNAIRSPSRNNATGTPKGIDPNLQPGSERGRTVHPASGLHTVHSAGSEGTEREGNKERSLSKNRIHTGRGGAGNTRSPSVSKRDKEEERREEELEERLVAERRGREEMAGKGGSFGRGGAGNMNQSRSRSRSRQPSLTRSSTSGPNTNSSPHAHQGLHLNHLLHHGGGGKGPGSPAKNGHDGELSKTTTRSSSTYVASGRGGYGNIISADQMTPEQRAQFEAEKLSDAQILSRYRSGHPHEIHSSGRGGGGNLAAPIETETEARMAAISLEEREVRDKVDAESARLGRTTGHGGLGNYQPPPIVEVDEEAGAGGRGRQSNELNGGGGGMMRKVMRSLSRQSGPRDRSAVRG